MLLWQLAGTHVVVEEKIACANASISFDENDRLFLTLAPTISDRLRSTDLRFLILVDGLGCLTRETGYLGH
jgi:hypothetical protein